MSIYRCWFRDDSTRLVMAKDHNEAALQAQELAGLQYADLKDDKEEFLRRCKVRMVECLDTGKQVKFK